MLRFVLMLLCSIIWAQCHFKNGIKKLKLSIEISLKIVYQIGTNTMKGNPTACLDGKVENNSEENMLFGNSHYNKLII